MKIIPKIKLGNNLVYNIGAKHNYYWVGRFNTSYLLVNYLDKTRLNKIKDPVFDNLKYGLYDKIENPLLYKEDIDLIYEEPCQTVDGEKV